MPPCYCAHTRISLRRMGSTPGRSSGADRLLSSVDRRHLPLPVDSAATPVRVGEKPSGSGPLRTGETHAYGPGCSCRTHYGFRMRRVSPDSGRAARPSAPSPACRAHHSPSHKSPYARSLDQRRNYPHQRDPSGERRGALKILKSGCLPRETPHPQSMMDAAFVI